MSNPHNLKVGQKLFAVSTRNYYRKEPETWEIEIAKIGRKWATAASRHRLPDRIDLETLRIDSGYASPGKCYLSEKQYYDERARREAWSNIYGRIPHTGSPPSMDDIRTIAGIFGLEEHLEDPTEGA